MKKEIINNIIPDITRERNTCYESEYEYETQEGGVYLGQEILDSGIITQVERIGFIPWLADGIIINPESKYIFWLEEKIYDLRSEMFYGVRKIS